MQQEKISLFLAQMFGFLHYVAETSIKNGDVNVFCAELSCDDFKGAEDLPDLSCRMSKKVPEGAQVNHHK